jgi:SpoIID/LytB domain protein
MKRSLALALVTLSALAGLASLGAPAASAGTSSTPEFHFYGGGWGHGVGMSQYGAYGMAVTGSTYTDILSQYYTGTAVKTIASPTKIRVGLIQSRTSTRLQSVSGPVTFRLDSHDGSLVANMPQGQTWTIQYRSDGHYWVRRQSGTYVGRHGWGGPTHDLFASYDAGAIIRVLDTGHRYQGAWLEFNIYRLSSGAYRGRLVLPVETNEYVYGIAEVPAGWPVNALRAQAVASRTYAVYKANTSGQYRAGCNCAVYASTADQVYIGYDRVAGVDGARWKAAADDTAWQVVTYGGTPIAAFYSSSSGGYTNSNYAEWGGTQLPYLQSRCDPGDYTTANPNRTWTVAMSGGGVGNRIDAYMGSHVGAVTSLTVNSRWGSGRIRSVTARGTSGSATLSGPQFRGALALKSSLVWINENLLVTGEVRTYYDKLDCAPGLPVGAGRAPDGGHRQNFEKGSIYIDDVNDHTVYFVSGPILDKYWALAGLTGFLGWPVTGVVDQAWGTQATFMGGTIYDSAATDPHESHGIVQDAYVNAGGPAGSLGLPTTDVRSSGDDRTQSYEHGSITCQVSTGNCTVQ